MQGSTWQMPHVLPHYSMVWHDSSKYIVLSPGLCVVLMHLVQPTLACELPFEALGQAAVPDSAVVGKGSIADCNNNLFVDCCDVAVQHSNCSLFAHVGGPTQCVRLDSVYQQTTSNWYAVQQSHSKQKVKGPEQPHLGVQP